MKRLPSQRLSGRCEIKHDFYHRWADSLRDGYPPHRVCTTYARRPFVCWWRGCSGQAKNLMLCSRQLSFSWILLDHHWHVLFSQKQEVAFSVLNEADTVTHLCRVRRVRRGARAVTNTMWRWSQGNWADEETRSLTTVQQGAAVRQKSHIWHFLLFPPAL